MDDRLSHRLEKPEIFSTLVIRHCPHSVCSLIDVCVPGVAGFTLLCHRFKYVMCIRSGTDNSQQLRLFEYISGGGGNLHANSYFCELGLIFAFMPSSHFYVQSYV